MPADIIEFNGITKLDLHPDRILDAAKEFDLTDVVIIGYDSNEDFYFASSKADGAEVLWLLELGKKKLLEIGDTDQ